MIGLGLNIAGNMVTAQRGARLIPTLTGTQYGTIDTAITFTGDFEVDIEFASTEAGVDLQGIFGDAISVGDVNYLRLENSAGSVAFRTPDGVVSWVHGGLHRDGKVNILTPYRVGNTIGLKLNGVIKASSVLGAASNVVINVIGAEASTGTITRFFKGEILSVKFTDQSGAEDVVTNFVFDSGSTTEQPSRGGGNNVSLINFATTDWNRYTLQRNILHDAGTIAEGWVGEDVVVNGGFDADTDWIKGAGVTISGGQADFVNAPTPALYQDISLTTERYLTTTDLVVTSGIFYVHAGGDAVGTPHTSTERLVTLLEPVLPNGFFIYSGFTFYGSIDNSSVQKLLEVA